MSNIIIPGATSIITGEVTSDLTVRDLLNRVKAYLYTGARETLNKLGSSLGPGDSNVSLQYGVTGITRGTRLSIDLEDLYVWSENSASDVQRGFNGTVPTSHAIGSLVSINPKFSNHEIFSVINEEIDHLSSPLTGLFKVDLATMTYDNTVQGYPLSGSEILDIYQIKYETTGDWNNWPVVQNYRLARQFLTFGAGTQIVFIYDPIPHNANLLIQVKRKFIKYSSLDELVTVSGVPDTAIDLLILGAVIRLSSGREIRRNFDESQGDTRRPGEVPPGANNAASRNIVALYQARLNEESARQYQMYPNVKSRPRDVIDGLWPGRYR